MNPWILATRPRTLSISVIPVALASAVAFHYGLFHWQSALICLSFAVLAQILANFANDYFDFKKGADTEKRLGAPRMVASGLIAPEAMKRAVLALSVFTFAVGSLALLYAPTWLIAVGIACLIGAVAYTAGPFPFAYHGLAELTVYIFFGLVAVMVTFYVQTGFWLKDTFFVATACGALAANICLINNYRDCETDAAAGKRTLVVRFGRPFGLWLYRTNIGIALLMPMILRRQLGYSVWILLPLLLLPLGVMLSASLKQITEGPKFNEHFAQTGAFLVKYALLLGLGILLS